MNPSNKYYATNKWGIRHFEKKSPEEDKHNQIAKQ